MEKQNRSYKISIKRGNEKAMLPIASTIWTGHTGLEESLKLATAIAATPDIHVSWDEGRKGFALSECRNFDEVKAKIEYLDRQ